MTCTPYAWSIGEAQSDANPVTCLERGFSTQGVPLCPHGYCLALDGHDSRATTNGSPDVVASASLTSRRHPARPYLTPRLRHPRLAWLTAPTATRPIPWAISSGSA